MTNTHRASLLGNDLSRAIDAYIASRGTDAEHEAMSSLLAVLLERATSMAASAVLGVDDKAQALEADDDQTNEALV